MIQFGSMQHGPTNQLRNCIRNGAILITDRADNLISVFTSANGTINMYSSKISSGQRFPRLPQGEET
jgi:hypothetical protein